MCQLEAKSVASYLRSKNNYYQPDVALRLVTKYEIKDAQAYLLEQDGKLLEAFALMKSDLKNQIETLTTLSTGMYSFPFPPTKKLFFRQITHLFLFIFQ